MLVMRREPMKCVPVDEIFEYRPEKQAGHEVPEKYRRWESLREVPGDGGSDQRDVDTEDQHC